MTIFTASNDGYLRLFKLKEGKNFEAIAQINLLDKILKAVPLEVSSKALAQKR